MNSREDVFVRIRERINRTSLSDSVKAIMLSIAYDEVFREQ